MTNITVNGKTFSVHKSKYANVNNLGYYAGRTLYDCYERPSATKVSIYNDWLKWASDNNVYHFGVSSYNAHTFTLQGLLEYEGKTFLLSISASANKAFII